MKYYCVVEGRPYDKMELHLELRIEEGLTLPSSNTQQIARSSNSFRYFSSYEAARSQFDHSIRTWGSSGPCYYTDQVTNDRNW